MITDGATRGLRFALFQNKGEAASDLFDSFNLFKAERLKLRFTPRSGRFFIEIID